jgi:hypothetical protein
MFSALSSQPSSFDEHIQLMVSCMRLMALPRWSSNELWNLDYDKIPIQKIQFLSTIFDGDVLFELPPLLLNAHNFSKMQGMDKKNDGHVW